MGPNKASHTRSRQLGSGLGDWNRWRPVWRQQALSRKKIACCVAVKWVGTGVFCSVLHLLTSAVMTFRLQAPVITSTLHCRPLPPLQKAFGTPPVLARRPRRDRLQAPVPGTVQALKVRRERQCLLGMNAAEAQGKGRHWWWRSVSLSTTIETPTEVEVWAHCRPMHLLQCLTGHRAGDGDDGLGLGRRGGCCCAPRCCRPTAAGEPAHRPDHSEQTQEVCDHNHQTR